MTVPRFASVARRSGHRIVDVIGKAWAFPTTLLGLAAVLVGALACGLSGRRASIFLGGNALSFVGHPFVATAVALGNVVLYGRHPSCQPHSVRHPSGQPLAHEERQHTIQAQWLGPLYLPLHLVFGTAACVLNGRWHGPVNWLETGPHASVPRPWPWSASVG